MPLRVLVLTSDTNLGDLVRRVLVDAQDCQVVLAQNNRQVQRLARQVVFDLAILDENPPEDNLPELARCLLEYQPHLRIAPLKQPAAMLPANGQARESAEIEALLHSLEAAIKRQGATERATTGGAASAQAQVAAGDHAPPNWVLDPGVTEQCLRSINFPNLIYAAVLVRRESLWAYRGSLPRAVAVELAQVLAQSWSREHDPLPGAGRAGGDMLRFIKLGAQQEFLLYARGLRFGLVLGLAYPTTTPFNAARSHMEQVLQALYASGLNAKASELPPAANQRQNGNPTDVSHALESSTGSADVEDDHGAAREAALSAFSALLSDVPEPTPNSMRRHVPGTEHIAWPWQAEVDDFPEEASVWLQSDDGKRSREHGESTCAFVLSPRNRQHELRGKIAAHVYQRLSELAYERGWRLEGISVRPNYLRFTAALPDRESGNLMLQTMRQELSNSLFRTFSDLAESRQGEDFWAADYLRSESGQPLLAQELRQYLQRAGRWLTEPVYVAGSQDSDR